MHLVAWSGFHPLQHHTITTNSNGFSSSSSSSFQSEILIGWPHSRTVSLHHFHTFFRAAHPLTMSTSLSTTTRANHTLPPRPSAHRSALQPLPSRMLFIRDCLRLSSSVLPRILPSVMLLTVYATFIALADLVWEAKWTTSYSVVSSLSVVVGLLLVFRNGTSYDRWYEGRKLWADASSTVENLARMIWVNVDTRKDAETHKAGWRLERKKRGLRLVCGFLVAVKHDLRGERGKGWQDFKGLLPEEWLKDEVRVDNDATATATAGGGGMGEGDIEQGSAGSGSISETSPLLWCPPNESYSDSHASLTLPHLILTELHIYMSSIRRAGLLDDLGPAGFSLLNTHLLTLSNIYSSMLRISTTPTPLIYAIHLKQSCFIYLVTLPLALVAELGWKMIPFVTVFSFMLIGLEGISSEIEDPFGGDKSDHDLDLYCSQVRYNVEALMLEINPGVRDE